MSSVGPYVWCKAINDVHPVIDSQGGVLVSDTIGGQVDYRCTVNRERKTMKLTYR